jgi:hypothetical protein
MPKTVYRKSAKGSAEIITRADKLAPKFRSALITVDGFKTDELLIATWDLLGDGAEILRTLVAGGYIEPDTNAVVQQRPRAPDADPISHVADVSKTQPIPKTGDAAESIARCKRAAAQFLVNHLGPNADGLAARIESAKNLTALSAALDRARIVLTDFKNKDIADEFMNEVSRHLAS